MLHASSSFHASGTQYGEPGKPSITYAVPEVNPTYPMRGPHMVLRGFEQAGWDADVIAALSDLNAQMEDLWGTVPLRKVGNGTAASGARCIHRALLRPRSSHIALTYAWHYPKYSLAAAKQLWRQPYGLVLDTYQHHAPWNKNTLLDRIKEKIRYEFAMSRASFIMAETPFLRDYTGQHFPGVETMYVPKCIWLHDRQTIEQTWHDEGATPQRAPVILFAGQVIPRKGVHDLLAAFAELATRYPEWSVEIVGPYLSDEYAQQLAQIIASNNLQPRVQFSPILTGEALYRRYRASSIYCMPTHHEGMPTTILEAMYFGGAIVSSNVGFISHQLDDGRCGLLIEPGNVDALREKLDQLMASEELRLHSMQAARARMVNTFTWEQYFEEVENACLRHIRETGDQPVTAG